jgi:hypothetical protein
VSLQCFCQHDETWALVDAAPDHERQPATSNQHAVYLAKRRSSISKEL